MIVGTVRETCPGERRVALTPMVVSMLKSKGMDVLVEPGAGDPAGFADDEYARQGATLAGDRAAVFAQAEMVCQVRALGANPRAGRGDLGLMRAGQTLIGFCEPLSDVEPIQAQADRGVRTFAVELMPRITRAQSMDALSSQAMVAGYKAAVLAADTLPRLFPMLMTAAGTVAAARVLVIGAGVAGLQAIATCRRLGGVVSAYDVRPAVREEVQSLGARFLEISLPASPTQDRGGYAKAMDDSFYRAQRELMAEAVSKSDVVITTAAVPGQRAPVLITGDMVARMPRGAVIIDLAAERGGNCELTRPDEAVAAHGVTILGPTNLPAALPTHASQLYARNLATFLLHLVKDGVARTEAGDEIIEQTLLTEGGQIVQRRVRELLGLPELQRSAV